MAAITLISTTGQISDGVASVILTANEVCTSIDGISKIAATVLAVFAYLKHLGQSMSKTLERIEEILEGFNELTGIIALVRRFKDWFVPDEKGQMMWQHAWREISNTICSTASTLLSFAIYLGTTLKVYSLGIALVPLNILTGVFSICSTAFDMWNNADALEVTAKKMSKAVAKLEQWKKEIDELPLSWTNLVQKNKKIWSERVSMYAASPSDKKKLENALTKKEQWKSFERGSLENLQHYGTREIVRLKAKIDSYQIAMTQSWITIAVDVLFIALSVLGIIALFISPGGLVLAMLLGGITASMADFSLFVAEKHRRGKHSVRF